MKLDTFGGLFVLAFLSLCAACGEPESDDESGLVSVAMDEASAVAGVEVYVATSGNDSASGSASSPLRTIQKAYDNASAGATIYVRGGTYVLTKQIVLAKSGTAQATILITAHPGERVILDGKNLSTDQWTGGAVIVTTGSYNHVRGLEIVNGPTFGAAIDGSAHHNTYELLNVHGTGQATSGEGKGIVIYGSAANNLILNCDSHHNRDRALANADGYQIGSTGTGNVLRGNRAWRNSDDGFDFFDGAAATLENNVAWENGYDDDLQRLGDGNGFKLGGHHAGKSSGGHTVIGNVAFRNPLHGFDYNSSSRAMTLYNNTAWHNGPVMTDGESWGANYYFYDLANTLTNNASCDGEVHTSGSTRNNSWDSTAADFVTLDYTAITGPRAADGSIVTGNFLRPSNSGRLVDAGVNVGRPYAGDAPDIGAFESGMADDPTDPPGPTPLAFTNGDFESGFDDWTSFGNTSVVTGDRYDGSASLRIGTGAGGSSQPIQGLRPGATYTLRAAGKTGRSAQLIYVGLTFYDAGGSKIDEPGIEVGGRNWTVSSGDITAPASFHHARVWTWRDASSRYGWVDGITVTAK